MQRMFVLIVFSVVLDLNEALKDDYENEYYENYDEYPLNDLESDEKGAGPNEIGKNDELRQIILNPRKRRERRRNHQGNNFLLKFRVEQNLNKVFVFFYF